MILIRKPDNSLSRLEVGDSFYIRWEASRETCYVLAIRELERLPLGEAIVHLIAASGYFRVQASDVIKTADRSLETMEQALRLCERLLRRLDA